jgi:hypothetical protein
MTEANQQGLFQLIYWTWLHNYEVIALAFGAVLAIALMMRNPKRIYLLFFLGFSLLIFQFEWTKHIAESLEQQTLQTVIVSDTQTKARKLVDFTLNRLIPFGSYLGGWGLIFMGMIIGGRNKNSLKV